MNIHTKDITIGDVTFKLETGKIARNADGAVMITCGKSVMLCTAVVSKKADPNKNFLPLSVTCIDKFYSVGKIPGGFIKREGKPSDNEVLQGRLVDRSMRPIFPEGFYNDIQIICTLLSHDKQSDSQAMSLIGASAACLLAGIPTTNVVAGCRIALIDDKLVTFPSVDQIAESKLDLFVSGTSSSVLMVESEANEVTEAQMIEAIEAAQKVIREIIVGIKELGFAAAKPKVHYKPATYEDLYEKMKDFASEKLESCYAITKKQERVSALNKVNDEINEKFVSEEHGANVIGQLVKKLSEEIVRGDILRNGKRIDGRGVADVRQISVEKDILPKEFVHGSALFTRGETQALVVTTLGGALDEQSIDGVHESGKERFMLHYNFPPYSVGEAEPLRGVGRREIGHGKLAYKALKAMLPTREEFPYAMRVVSEITESNGSSSMATVCGASMSMMSTGIPMKKPVAGIAMGLIKDCEEFAVLTDIMGDEDHLGDMDFKVAGTDTGITALQMDMKINGITADIMKAALKQALDARLHILGKMNALISEPSALSEHTPKIFEMNVPSDKIADVIGKSGATIKDICEKTGTKINIENDGLVRIFAANAEIGEEAMSMIKEILTDIVVGNIYEGTVDKIMAFGAIVLLPGKKSGMVHISEIVPQRVEDINEFLVVGQKVTVKVLDLDDRKRVKLSIKAANPEYADLPKEERADRGERRDNRSNDRGDRGDRGNGGGRGGFGGGRRDDRGNGGSDRNERNDRSDRGDRRFAKPNFNDSNDSYNESPEINVNDFASHDDGHKSGNRSFSDLAKNINSYDDE